MNTIVGSCPKCGAPIYAPSVWHGITPPPSTPSCGCHPQAHQTTTGTTIVLNRGRRSTDEQGRGP